MNREELIKEIDNATNAMREITRVVNETLCHARHYKSNEETEEAYNKGLEDAWELMKKIIEMYSEDVKGVYGTFFTPINEASKNLLLNLMKAFTPQEALAKLEAYEKEKEINVGDVVILRNLGKAVVLFIHYDSETADVMIDDGHIFQYEVIKDLKKTGEHFDIEKMLEQLKGE